MNYYSMGGNIPIFGIESIMLLDDPCKIKEIMLHPVPKTGTFGTIVDVMMLDGSAWYMLKLEGLRPGWIEHIQLQRYRLTSSGFLS